MQGPLSGVDQKVVGASYMTADREGESDLHVKNLFVQEQAGRKGGATPPRRGNSGGDEMRARLMAGRKGPPYFARVVIPCARVRTL